MRPSIKSIFSDPFIEKTMKNFIESKGAEF